jgi:MinD-like ATPase involved in chromosome partitioning or flagellar assembly
MSEQEMPIVITAIARAEIEGFIASTLFAQGWSVVFRAIDWQSLEEFATEKSIDLSSTLLIYGSDLPGISKEKVKQLSSKFSQVIGFATNTSEEFAELKQAPIVAADLVSLVRGFVRTPMLREFVQAQNQLRRARIFAMGSAGTYTGCTLISLNLAMELSTQGKSTLLIDANFRAPSIFDLISMRNTETDPIWKTVAPNLAVFEVTQTHATEIDAIMLRTGKEFDYVIIDLGSIAGLSNRLTDRRWTSTVTTWSCDHADELIVVSRPDLLGVSRLHKVIELLTQTLIRAKISFVMNMKSSGKKGEAEQSKFLTLTSPIKPFRVRSIGTDIRAVLAAQDQRATLIETNERSAVRKSIAELASELST